MRDEDLRSFSVSLSQLHKLFRSFHFIVISISIFISISISISIFPPRILIPPFPPFSFLTTGCSGVQHPDLGLGAFHVPANGSGVNNPHHIRHSSHMVPVGNRTKRSTKIKLSNSNTSCLGNIAIEGCMVAHVIYIHLFDLSGSQCSVVEFPCFRVRV